MVQGLRKKLDRAYGCFLLAMMGSLVAAGVVLSPLGESEGSSVWWFVAGMLLLFVVGSLAGIVLAFCLRRHTWRLPLLGLTAAALPFSIYVSDEIEQFPELVLVGVIATYYILTFWFTLGWFLSGRKKLNADPAPVAEQTEAG